MPWDTRWSAFLSSSVSCLGPEFFGGAESHDSGPDLTAGCFLLLSTDLPLLRLFVLSTSNLSQ